MQLIAVFKLHKFHYNHFLIGWLGLNLIQAAFTELHNDESYYWIYIQKLSWGYYDHPPMVALLIKLSYAIFENELGVRLGNVLILTLGLLFFFKTLPKQEQHEALPYLILLSIPFLNYIGFLVFPDGGLVAFGAVFLWVYQKWVLKSSVKYSLILGIVAAAMLYSKYHAGLFFALIVLSNLSLLRNKHFYLAMTIALILFLPHIWWQYQNDFPSIRFHLVERASSFKLKYATRFVSEQFLAVGPILIVAFFIKSRDIFERALVFLVRGFFLFFLFSSLRGIVHIQWTSLVWLPAVFLVIRFWNEKLRNKWWYALIIPHLVLTILFRLYLATDWFPGEKVGPHYVQGQEEWYTSLGEKIGNRPMIFLNDLKEPSAYTFYTGKVAIALYPDGTKRSQYDLWQQEKEFEGKSVVIASKRPFAGSKEFNTGGKRKVYWKEVDEYRASGDIY